jgi:hypothetical protein
MTLAHEIANRIASFGAIVNPVGTGGLGFVVLERWPVRPSGNPANPIPGETPTAFDETRARKMKRTIVVMDQGEVSNPARQAFELRRWDSFPLIYIFAETHQNGKEAVGTAYLFIERYLVGWTATVDGQKVGFVPDNRLPLDDSEDFPESVVQVCRFRATGTRTIVPIP